MSQFGLMARLRGRGIGAIARRMLREIYAPETRIGRAIRPVTAILWGAMKAARPARTQEGAAARDIFTFYYDLDVAPITFDFVCFLALAEAMRRRHGMARLEVVFVPGRKDGLRAELQSYEAIVDPDARRWRLHNLCIPLLALVPACRGYTVCATREEASAVHAMRPGPSLPDGYEPAFPMPPSGKELTRAADAGEDLRVLAAPPQALAYARQWIAAHGGGKRLVTITLREYAYMPERNSNFAAWSAFAHELEARGYRVVVVPDADTAMDEMRPEFAPFLAFREACWNVALRSALYESAFLSLGSSGGAMAMCWFDPTIRYLMFKILVPNVPQATESFLKDRGYRIGEAPPFAGAFQKWVWEPDDLAIIRREFDAMEASITRAARNPSANP